MNDATADLECGERWRRSALAASSTSCDRLRVCQRLASLTSPRRARPAAVNAPLGVARACRRSREGPEEPSFTSKLECVRTRAFIRCAPPPDARIDRRRMACAVAALASHLKPATPPPLPAHASTASSSYGRGRTRLRARTLWLCRAYPKGHSWRRTHSPWPRVLSHCRLACSLPTNRVAPLLTSSPRPLRMCFSHWPCPHSPRHHLNTSSALTGASILADVRPKALHPCHLHPRTLFKRPHRAARQC